MSVHPVLNTSATLVCGAVHKQSGSTCLRAFGHDGQHLLSHDEEHGLWTKDPLSCTCKTAGLCSSQKCVFTWPIGPRIAQEALASETWYWEGAL